MRPEGIKIIHRWANNPEVMPSWYGERKSLKQIKDDWKPHYFSDKYPYSGRCFSIEVQDRIIGMINYNKIDIENKSVEIDIIIGEKENWSKGYGTDALKTFANYLFQKFKLNRIWVEVRTSNTRAIKIYKNVGFRKDDSTKSAKSGFVKMFLIRKTSPSFPCA